MTTPRIAKTAAAARPRSPASAAHSGLAQASLPHPDLQRLERLAHWMDGAFKVPGLGWRFGLDGLLGLVPGAGDTVAGLIGLYMLMEARRLGAPSDVILRMLANLGVDWAVGSVPILGDVFDFAFKANRRNLDLLRRHLAARPVPLP